MSSDHDPIHGTPRRDLAPTTGRGSFGSTARALAGEVELDIGGTMSEAWALTKGSKGVIIGGSIVGYLIYIVLGMAAYLVDPPTATEGATSGQTIAGTLFQFAGTILSYPIFVGIYMYAVKRAASDPSAGFGDVTGYIPYVLPMLGLYLLQVILVMLGFLLLILPGIYLSVAYTPAVVVMLDKNRGIWEALETSRKGVSGVWFQFFGLMIVVAIIAAFGTALTLGIGAIWLFPWATLCLAVAYRKIFGYGEDG